MEPAHEKSFKSKVFEQLKPFVEYDKQITKKLAVSVNDKSPFGNWRPLMVYLEYSCNGFFWIVLCYITLWFSQNNLMKQFAFNLHTALVLDGVLLLIFKPMFQRRRPPYNAGGMYTLVDKYSFPSGHASRSVLIAKLFCRKLFFGYFSFFSAYVWAVIVCFSRVIMGRHHVGDILVGAFLGLLEADIILHIWFSADTTYNILKTISF